MRVLYNEIDTYCCDWLSNLMDAGALTPGDIDERSIADLDPTVVARYDRFHTFAGIGVWEYAIMQSGLADRSGIWTGSCPCQPFSAAGKAGGFDDERHLWPAWFHLVEVCRPRLVLGEQVASKDGLAWFDLVSADMEGAAYAIGAGDLCAASFGAPHIRQRQYFSAIRLDYDDEGLEGHPWDGLGPPRWAVPYRSVAPASEHGGVEYAHGGSVPVALGGAQGRDGQRSDRPHAAPRTGRPGPVNGFWRDADWLACRDDKWRPVESGTFPLAHGATARVGRLRAYGNAIVAQQAIEWCVATRQFIEIVESGI